MKQLHFKKAVLLAVLLVALIGAGAYVVFSRQGLDFLLLPNLTPIPTFSPTPSPTPILTPPPSPKPGVGREQVSLRAGQREGSLLIQKIYPDHVTGLNFVEYPIATGEGYPVTLRLQESVSNGCTITLTLVEIKGEIAMFNKKTDLNKPCPICLAGNTFIDTPNGTVAVKDLKQGMAVWTVNASGEREIGTILKTAKTPVPAAHHLVHLVLSDGRELFVSPGHPTADGRLIGDLAEGDVLNGAAVLKAELVPYKNDYTYDILPSGETGTYFANNIPISSTLKSP